MYFDMFRSLPKSLAEPSHSIKQAAKLVQIGNCNLVATSKQWPGFSGLLGLPEKKRENQEEAMFHGHFPKKTGQLQVKQASWARFFSESTPIFLVTAPIRGRARMSFFLSLHLRSLPLHLSHVFLCLSSCTCLMQDMWVGWGGVGGGGGCSRSLCLLFLMFAVTPLTMLFRLCLFLVYLSDGWGGVGWGVGCSRSLSRH